MDFVTFVSLFVACLLAFAATCGLLMAAVAIPQITWAVWTVILLAVVVAVVVWLKDGNIYTFPEGAAVAAGAILGIIAKWRGLA